MSVVPHEIRKFEAFLVEHGLARVRDDYALHVFGDRVIEYSDGTLAVQVSSDRSVWCVCIADVVGRPDEWYDAALVRDLLDVRGEDAILLVSQIEVVERMWEAIRVRFQPMNRDDSHLRLAQLRRQRLKRLFPGLQ